MKRYILLIALILFNSNLFSQKNKKQKKEPLDEISLSALKWRSIGPALTSGRISDLAVNPNRVVDQLGSNFFISAKMSGTFNLTGSLNIMGGGPVEDRY